MKRLALVVLGSLLGLTVAPAAAAELALVFRNQIVTDPQGLGLEVFRMLVPRDWRFDGGISWNFAKNPPEAFIVYTVTSPDGNAVIQQFPHLSMYASQDPQQQTQFAQMGNTIMAPLGAAQQALAIRPRTGSSTTTARPSRRGYLRRPGQQLERGAADRIR